MIKILFILLFLTFIKFLLEESLLAILMTIELLSVLSFFIILNLNLEMVGLNTIMVVLLTLQVTESVLSLGFFVNLMRFSSNEKISSMMMLKL